MNGTENSNIILRPLGDKVLVELIDKEKVTDSGIILSSADPAEVNRGKVLATGPDVLDIQEGDVILPNWNKAIKSSMEGNVFYIVKEEDIVLVFE